MALLGDTIDPRLMVFDYSQDRSGEIMGNAIAGLGRDVGNEMDRRRKLQSEVKAGKTILKYAMERYPDEKPYLQSIAQEIDSPDLPLSDQAAMASRIADMIELGVGEQRYQREFALRQQAENRAERESQLDAGMRLPQIEAATRANSAAQSAMEAEAIFAPDKLAFAIETLSQNPKLQSYFGSPEDIKKYSEADPLAQSSIADKIMALAPERKQLEYTANFPMTVDGQAMEVPGFVDKQSGSFTPATVNGVNGSDVGVNVDGGAGVLPPKPSISIGKPVQTPGGLTEKQKFDIQQQEKTNADKAQEAVAKSQAFLSSLEKLENHPGFDSLFGVGLTKIPGTDGASAKAIFDQLEGMGFLESVQAMKGMGALSNAEGQKLSTAFLGLSPSMKEEDAKQRIKEIKEIVKKGIQKAATMQQPVAPSIDPMQGAGLKLKGMLLD